VEGRIPSLLEPKLLAGQLYWLEQRPDQQGRTTLMGRPFGAETAGAAAHLPAEELTPGAWNLRSRIHGYGGGACALGQVAGQAIAVFVDDRDRCLWRLDLGPAGAALNEPIQLTRPAARAFGGGLIDPWRQRWIGVVEVDGRDQLVAVSLLGGEPVTLHQAADFCGYPTLSPRGSHLAWVEWQQPHLPWERSQLWLGCFAAAGADSPGEDLGEGLTACRPVAGSDNTSRQAISVFQPLWTAAPGALAADLLVACDRNGWWNLERLVAAEALQMADLVQPLGEVFAPPPAWQPLLPMEAEFATPQWVLGLSTTAWDGSQLLAAACFEGSWQLGRISWPSAPARAPRPHPARPGLYPRGGGGRGAGRGHGPAAGGRGVRQ